MAFKRWGHTFDGPWPNTDILKPEPGIWVVWLRNPERWRVLEVGHSENVRHSLVERCTGFQAAAGKEEIHYSVTYTPELSDDGRQEAAERIKRIARPGP